MDISEDGEWIYCSFKGCESKIKNHYWGYVKAERWFFSKLNDVCYCPIHIPDWVEAWRENKKKKEKNV